VRSFVRKHEVAAKLIDLLFRRKPLCAQRLNEERNGLERNFAHACARRNSVFLAKAYLDGHAREARCLVHGGLDFLRWHMRELLGKARAPERDAMRLEHFTLLWRLVVIRGRSRRALRYLL